jgi:drug/metabolite transporter (DMT)-like permease
MNLVKYTKLLVCIGVFASAAGTIMIRYSNATAVQMLFYRLLFTVLLLAVPVLGRKGKETLAAIKENYKLFILTALCSNLAMLIWIYALKNTSIASAVILSNTHPIIVVAVSFLFFKVKYNKKAILGVAITIIGCTAMSANDYMIGGSHIKGDLFALAASTFWGLYILSAQKARQTYSIDVFMFINYSLSFIYIAVFSFVIGEHIYPMPVNEFIIFICLALFCTLIGNGLVDWGLGYVNPTFASLAYLLENVYTIILAIIFFKELPIMAHFTWGSVLIAGILIYNKYENL